MTLPTHKQLLRYHALVVITGVLIMAGKFLAWLLTGSNAILSDALESIVNVVTGSFALYSLFLSAKPQDKEHPYGHGKVEYISATIEGALIFVAGSVIIVKAAYNLFRPQEVSHIDTGLLIIAGSGLLNFFMGAWLTNTGKRKKSLTLTANGEHLKTDAYTTAGLLLGLGLIYVTGLSWMDNAVAILFGGIILYTGFRILRRSVAGIMDEADFELLQEIVESLENSRKPDWIDVHNLRVIRFGTRIHIDCHVTVPWYYTTRESHYVVKEIENHINRNYEEVELFIHADPCLYEQCRICSVNACPHRQSEPEEKITWQLETVLVNKKHGIVETK